jgi:RNA polymerase primary sigma factor
VKKDSSALLWLIARPLQKPDDPIQAALAELSERERRVLELRYGLRDGQNYSLQEVGQQFGISGERIRQIEARAISKLRRIGRTQAGPPSGLRRPLKVAVPRPV